MGIFAGMRVLITGSTRGVGRATVERFLEEGATVIVHGRNRDAAEKVARELGAHATAAHGDLLDRASIAQIAGKAGDIDVLVNCAGIFEERSIEEADEAHWDRIIEVNLTAAWALSRALIDGLRCRKGVIVNVSSDSGLLGYARSSVYCASKGALIGLTRAIAVELAPDVRALAVCPGPIDTDMMRENSAPEQWADFPILKRVAQASEVAEAMIFAASPKATFQTGSVITIDGGTTGGRRMV
jgi:meso-butanediol dehydrogenase/(S,S)-butanediol dehydrogenase/diacetyl reductase